MLGERAFLVVQDVVDEVTVPDSVRRAIVAIVRHTREQPGVEMGASTRAAIHLAAASKARAAMHGRIVAELEDIVALAPHVLPHRLLVEGDPVEVVARAVASAL